MTQVPKTAYLAAIHPRASELGALDSLKQDELNKIIALILSDGDIPNAFDNISKYLKENRQINLCVDIGDNVTPLLVSDIKTWMSSNQLPSDYGICVPCNINKDDFNSLITELNPTFAAIRVKLNSRHAPQYLYKNLESLLKGKPDNTNTPIPISLILDLGYIAGHDNISDSGNSCEHDPDVHTAITVCSNILNGLSPDLRDNFYHIFILGGSFPRQISFVKNSAIIDKSNSAKVKQPIKLPLAKMAFHFRREYKVWQEIQKQYENVLYGDYSVFNPNPNGNGFRPPAPNIRYARDDRWILLRGFSKSRYHKGTGIYIISNQLKASRIMDPPDFSLGDMQYDLVSRHATENEIMAKKAPIQTGGGTQWLKWSSSHHLAYVVRQLSKDGVI